MTICNLSRRIQLQVRAAGDKDIMEASDVGAPSTEGESKVIMMQSSRDNEWPVGVNRYSDSIRTGGYIN